MSHIESVGSYEEGCFSAICSRIPEVRVYVISGLYLREAAVLCGKFRGDTPAGKTICCRLHRENLLRIILRRKRLQDANVFDLHLIPFIKLKDECASHFSGYVNDISSIVRTPRLYVREFLPLAACVFIGNRDGHNGAFIAK